MNEYIAYHGTPRSNIDNIIRTNFFISQGNNHWLGDGIYFYPEKVYAYKWNINNSMVGNPKRVIPVLLSQQGILEVNLKCAKNRTFDLDTVQHKMILKKTIENIADFEEECIEGVALNVLFNELGYNKKYDMIVATFALRREKMELPFMRLDFYPEKQICIKNHKCIKNIKEIKITEKEKTEFDILIKELSIPIEYKLKEEEQTYTSRRKVNRTRKVN